MSGKARPSMRRNVLDRLDSSNLSETSKECIRATFKKYDELNEKATGKKPVIIGRGEGQSIGLCPECEMVVLSTYQYCTDCGQKLKWSDDDED